MFIYLIVNHVTGKYYVGQHKGTDLKKYLQKKFWAAKHQLYGSSHLFNSIRKHGREAFTIHALLSDVQTKPELDAYERDFIAFLRSQDPEYGYNICRGGEGGGMLGHKHSSETKDKIRRANEGRQLYPITPENEALRTANWQESLEQHGGSFQTSESIEKIKQARAQQDETYRLAVWKRAEQEHGEEWTKRRVITRRRNGSFGKMSESGRKAQISAVVAACHRRWHVGRGLTNPSCKFCK